MEDYCRGAEAVLERGQVGELYNIGSRSKCKNINLCVCRAPSWTLSSPPVLRCVTASPDRRRRYACSALMHYVYIAQARPVLRHTSRYSAITPARRLTVSIRFVWDRRPLAAVALSGDSSALICISNDYSFDEGFARRVLGLSRRADCLLGISASGNLRNVVRAVEAACSSGIQTIGLRGGDGGQLSALCDLTVIAATCAMIEWQLGKLCTGGCS